MKTLLKISILVILLISHTTLAHSALRCEDVFHDSKKITEVMGLKPPDPAITEIGNLKSFGQAMTEGMLLRPEQTELFEVYRRIFFGDPNTSVNNQTLQSVTDILSKHPDLEKPHFREYEISAVEKVYETPESLEKYLKSQTQTAGQVRSNLLQIDANLGFWRKVLDYQDPQMPGGLTKDQQKEFAKRAKDRFENYLNRMISKTNRDLLADLKNDKDDYQKKAKALFKTLKYLQEWMDKKGRNTQAIRQAMVDLVHTVGFGNQATQVLLKSKNGLDKIEGLKKVLDEREDVAMDLGYADHFAQLQSSLKVAFPTGLSKNESSSENIQRLEQELLKSSFTTKPTETVRVRSLSIQEAPFRSCLGGSDCSTRTYFDKALDPNYNYFTMTDSQNRSNGHVTVVLGQAQNPKTGQMQKVAFVDKLQNVPNQKIPAFLTAVSKSLAEKDYLLGIPAELGDSNSFSNMDTIRHFVAKEILPKLGESLSSFAPNPHQYDFQNKYSRADSNLDVKIFEGLTLDASSEIKTGREYKKSLASPDLNKHKLVQDLLNLKNSSDPSDLQKYVSSGQLVGHLEKLQIFTVKEFQEDLGRIQERRDLPFSLRKQAALETLLLKPLDETPTFDLKNFNEPEQAQIASEIRQWSKSSDPRKKNFANGLERMWNDAAVKGRIKDIESLLALKIFDINSRNESGHSLLVIAAFNHQKPLIEWLIENPQMNLAYKDAQGHTEVEQIRLLGKSEIADFIESKRPELKSRKFAVKERNADGSPILSFVKIPGGTFRMGDTLKNKFPNVPVTITRPFEFMSTKTTQKMWKGVAVLANIYARGLYKTSEDPSRYKGEQYPVETVSHDMVTRWLHSLNRLSKLDNSEIQRRLEDLIPGHKKGHVYRLPTEAEREFVERLGGLANGLFSHGNTEKNLGEHAWYSGNSSYMGQAVGLKKPIIFNGEPIYDIHGLVWEWTSDYWQGGDNNTGGIDPQGPPTGFRRIIRGGSHENAGHFLRTGYRASSEPGAESREIGFRLVRNVL